MSGDLMFDKSKRGSRLREISSCEWRTLATARACKAVKHGLRFDRGARNGGSRFGRGTRPKGLVKVWRKHGTVEKREVK